MDNKVKRPFIYSKNQIDKSIKILNSHDKNDSEYKNALERIQYWRNIHDKPTQECFKDILECIKCNKKFKNTIVTYRLKRLVSIVNKLNRKDSNLKLSELNDIGGCRIILDNLEQVINMVELLKSQFEIRNKKDYISKPRESGYRSYHLLVDYCYMDRKYRIEIQVRTKLQHYWATSVEAISETSNTNYKDPELSMDNIKKCLAIISNIFYMEERAVQIEDCVKKANKLKSVKFILSDLTINGVKIYQTNKLKSKKYKKSVKFILSDLKATINGVKIYQDGSNINNKLFILKFDKNNQQLIITSFDESDLYNALNIYSELESSNNEDGSYNVVLTYANNLKQLKIAYPNYSYQGESDKFINKVEKYIK